MDGQCQLLAPWTYRKVKQAWYHKNHPFIENHYNLKLSKDSVMSWSSWEGWIDIAYLKTEYQDQNPRNTL